MEGKNSGQQMLVGPAELVQFVLEFAFGRARDFKGDYTLSYFVLFHFVYFFILFSV